MKEEIKYDRHEEEWEKAINDEDRKKVSLTWLDQKLTLDRWRHGAFGSFIRYRRYRGRPPVPNLVEVHM